MMGLMGNVAEVAYLRRHLMQSQYVSVFRYALHVWTIGRQWMLGSPFILGIVMATD